MEQNKEMELTMVFEDSDRRLNELLNKEFVTLEELEEIEQHEKIVEVENCGNSGKHNGYTWFNVKCAWNEEYSVYVKSEE
jgi:hypothetical protein